MPQDEFKAFSKEFRDGLKNVIMDEYIPAFNLYMDEYAKKQAESPDSIFRGMTEVKQYKPVAKDSSLSQEELDKNRRLELQAKVVEKSVEKLKAEEKAKEEKETKAKAASEKRKLSIKNTQSNKPKETYKPK